MKIHKKEIERQFLKFLKKKLDKWKLKKTKKQKTNPNNIHVTLSRCDGLGPFLYIDKPSRFSNVAPELFLGFLTFTLTTVWITVSNNVILHVE